MNYKLLSLIFGGFLLLTSTKSMAQFDFGVYHLSEVPQSNLYNPAFIPAAKIHFGIPALSSVYGGFGTSGATYDQFFYKQNDSLYIDPKSILEHSKSLNNLSSHSAVQWLNAGMCWNKFYFSASISDIIDINSFYTDKLVSLVANGNAEYVGQTIDLTPLELKALHYREYAIGAAYQLNDKLNIGLRAKILFGKSAVLTDKMDLSVTTTEDYYYLDVKSNFIINTSIPEDSGITKGQYLFSPKNFGLGADFGATYKFDDKLTISASVLDLGYMNYNRWQKNYQSMTEFTYKGVDMNQFEGLDKAQQEARWDAIKDSLIGLFEVENHTRHFTTYLTAKVLLGAQYQYSDKDRFGVLLRTEIFKGKLRPSFTANYYRQLIPNLGLLASYSIYNRGYFNVGLGFVANFKPIQMYITTDNIIGVFVPNKVHYSNIHFGINYIIPSQKVQKTMINL